MTYVTGNDTININVDTQIESIFIFFWIRIEQTTGKVKDAWNGDLRNRFKGKVESKSDL